MFPTMVGHMADLSSMTDSSTKACVHHKSHYYHHLVSQSARVDPGTYQHSQTGDSADSDCEPGQSQFAIMWDLSNYAQLTYPLLSFRNTI
jgi:hypothetical protein